MAVQKAFAFIVAHLAILSVLTQVNSAPVEVRQTATCVSCNVHASAADRQH